MKYYLIAGEASGDLHASHLMHALREKDPDAEFRFFGGKEMNAVRDSTLVVHYREMAYMGVIPVLLNIRKVLRNMRICRTDVRAWQPDAVILVDYPSFNLRIARFVKKTLSIPVFYYISPKIWAWKRHRIRTVRKYIDCMLCIFPFEVDFYRKYNCRFEYVGNPTAEEVASFTRKHEKDRSAFLAESRLPDRPFIALLPGSRKQEIRKNLPAMLDAARRYADCCPVIVAAPGIEAEVYSEYCDKNTAVFFDGAFPLFRHAEAAIVTSGTATLEAALFRVPQAVCYRIGGGALANFIFRNFFHVKYISLVNLIAGREVVKELFGAKFSSENIKNELDNIMYGDEYRAKMLEGYDSVAAKLGDGKASERAAGVILDSVRR